MGTQQLLYKNPYVVISHRTVSVEEYKADYGTETVHRSRGSTVSTVVTNKARNSSSPMPPCTGTMEEADDDEDEDDDADADVGVPQHTRQ
mmetsp:Transcript_23028/g.24523  ORF Transcript_23028/g.24523 Transcript_23028/m.24523 type:complete len:90 (+) Transcript_23028:641-910(+)